jgi:hypothetical protein
MIPFEVMPEMNVDDVDSIKGVNLVLKRLAQRRVDRIEVSGNLLNSKLAWKIATYRQSMLYRTVALTSGCALCWNAGNSLCSMLTARALIETIALLIDFESRLHGLLDREDLAGIDQLIMRLSFSTRDQDWLAEHPDCEAVSVLTLVDKLSKLTDIDGLRRIYDMLSERCHPNSAGHQFFFGTLDTRTGTTTYSKKKEHKEKLNLVLLSASLIALAETAIDNLDTAVARTAEVQHQLDGLKDQE